MNNSRGNLYSKCYRNKNVIVNRKNIKKKKTIKFKTHHWIFYVFSWVYNNMLHVLADSFIVHRRKTKTDCIRVLMSLFSWFVIEYFVDKIIVCTTYCIIIEILSAHSIRRLDVCPQFIYIVYDFINSGYLARIRWNTISVYSCGSTKTFNVCLRYLLSLWGY